MKNAYLVFYNLLQFCGWSAILFTGRLDYLMWFQTIQLIEVVHCMVGLVKSSAFQTFMQILSRIVIVWVALVPYPETHQTIGLNMILWAWPLAETTRYIYYALNLLKLNLYIVTWARYTFFIVLYPLGVSGELLILYTLILLLRRTGDLSYQLPNQLNISFSPDVILVIFMLSYVPCKLLKKYYHTFQQQNSKKSYTNLYLSTVYLMSSQLWGVSNVTVK